MSGIFFFSLTAHKFALLPGLARPPSAPLLVDNVLLEVGLVEL